MKIKYLGAVLAIALTTGVMAQKDQLKALEKAMKGNDISAIKSAISGAEAAMGAATDVEKAQFYYLKGVASFDLAKKNSDKSNNLLSSAKAFAEMEAVEKATGKNKFTNQAKVTLEELKGTLVNSAVEDQNNKKFKEGTAKLEQVYAMDKSNQLMLYYAANFAVMGKDYDKALELYEELKRLDYSGEGMSYQAKSLISEEFDSFNTKAERDQAVKLKTHVEPKDEKIPSKRGEIYSNIALILVEKGRKEEAKVALRDARKANPDDIGLIISEANIYYDEKNYTQYMSLLEEAAVRMPENAELFFNLGVASIKVDNFDKAEEYYLKATKINPKYADAFFNLAILKVDKDAKLVEEMNGLGTSAKDNKRYDELKKERENLFKQALPYLEKTIELDATNVEAQKTLLNIYSLLDMTDKYKALKAKMEN
ncbi:MAG: tetratricopeptide repeat protein [Flavobacterium sp.]